MIGQSASGLAWQSGTTTVLDGEPSKKVQVHQVWQGESRSVVAEYEDEQDLVKRYKPNLGRDERILVRKTGQVPRYVPVRQYIEEVKARKQ